MLAESEIACQATSISRQKNREVSIIHVYTVSQVMTSIFIGHSTASNESHANYSERIGSPPNTSRLDWAQEVIHLSSQREPADYPAGPCVLLII